MSGEKGTEPRLNKGSENSSSQLAVQFPGNVKLEAKLDGNRGQSSNFPTGEVLTEET